MPDTRFQGFSTRAVHAGQDPDPVTGAVIPPISLSTTYTAPTIDRGDQTPYNYVRLGNPNRENFEKAVAALEGAKYGLAFSSGMAAVASVLSTLPAGSHVVVMAGVYHGTHTYSTQIAQNHGIDTDFIDLSLDPDDILKVLKPNTKIVWIETPTNPALRIVDIQRVAKHVDAHGAMLVIDNTFMTPYFQNPLSLGAHAVMHSATKYINGHSDVLIGVVATNDEALHKKLRAVQMTMGAVPSPMDCFLARRGLITLEVRMRQHAQNAQAVAEWLESHASYAVTEVLYPGLASHPQHALARRQQRGFGGMLSFRLKGTADDVKRVLDAFKLITVAVSLGGPETLIERPAVMAEHLSPEVRASFGITDTMLRMSVGLETAQDIIDDLDQALKQVYGSQ